MSTNFTNKNISSISLKDTIYNVKAVPFHATDEEWAVEPLASYIPKDGEIVIYDGINGEKKIKIGDGTSVVGVLSFAVDNNLELEGIPADAKVVGTALSNKITAPTTTEVGQTIVVKSINSNGNPITWEAADLPSIQLITWEEDD